MGEIDAEPEFSDEERNRIITDIMHWKCELEADQGFSPEKFQSFVDKLQSMDGEQLKSFWETHVGEWLASRDDLNFHDETDEPNIVEWHDLLTSSLKGGASTGGGGDFDSWLETQFKKLTSGERTDYGYVVNVDVRPKTRGVA